MQFISEICVIHFWHQLYVLSIVFFLCRKYVFSLIITIIIINFFFGGGGLDNSKNDLSPQNDSLWSLFLMIHSRKAVTVLKKK